MGSKLVEVLGKFKLLLRPILVQFTVYILILYLNVIVDLLYNHQLIFNAYNTIFLRGLIRILENYKINLEIIKINRIFDFVD
jgi:hypothetical protein